MDKIDFLLQQCKDHPELYNQVALDLKRDFDIKGANIALLVTYYIMQYGGNSK